jgi:hypothetical protein
MGKIQLAEEAFPATPAAGYGRGWFDSSNSQWCQKNDAGLYLGDMSIGRPTQIAAHSADTYYLGMQLPSFSMQVGMIFEWLFPVVKAAGVAAPIYTIRIGALQTIADTARLVINGAVQTAVADTGLVRVLATVRSVGVAGVIQGLVHLQHNLAATGLANTPAGFSLVEGTSAGFDNTALQGLFIGLSVNPGAAGAWVVNQCIARCWY